MDFSTEQIISILPLLFLVLVGCGIGLFIYNNKGTAVVKQEFKKHKPSNFQDIYSGTTVKVRGKVRLADKHLFAPFSGRKCVYYHIIAEESSRNNKFDIEILDETMQVDFYLEDEKNQKVLISTESINVTIQQDIEYKDSLVSQAPKRARNYVKEYLIKRPQYSLNTLFKTALYLEGAIIEGDTISVLGFAKPNPNAAKNLEDGIVPILIGCEKAQNVYISGDPDIQ